MNPFLRGFVLLSLAVFCIISGFLGYTVYSLPDVNRLLVDDPDTTAFMQYRLETAQNEGLPIVLRQASIPLEDIPRLFQRTVVLAEDAAFWVHEGIDWHEVQEAMDRNLEEGRIVRGASTISQQTAKNLYLSPDRNFLRKFKEYLITQDLEKHLPKKRILELYLNFIEFGNGVFGIQKAAEYYFGKDPAQMSLSEMVRLAAIIPAPLSLDPNDPSGSLRWRSREILRRLRHYDFISENQYGETREQLTRFFGKF